MFARIRSQLARLRRDQAGLTTVEYVIVLTLIAVAAVGTWDKFGENINRYIDQANTDLEKSLGSKE